MLLTPAQLTAIKADIAANGDLNVFPNSPDGNSAIAVLYNLTAVPDYIVWSTSVAVGVLYDQIVWANLTPADVPDTTQLWENRSLACQGKQLNLQIILQGQASLNGSRANVRAGLQDALTAIPSGVSGANRAAGWTAVQTALQRKATRFEKVLATGAGTTASPSLMGAEGSIAYQDVQTARDS